MKEQCLAFLLNYFKMIHNFLNNLKNAHNLTPHMCISYLQYTASVQYAETGNRAHGSYIKFINITRIEDAQFAYNLP